MKRAFAVLCLANILLFPYIAHAKTVYSTTSNRLESAIKQGDLQIVRSLINSGADPNMRFADGFTPLIEAAFKGKTDVVRLLLSRHAGPQRPGEKGVTPLIAATVSGNVQTMVLILDRHVNVDLGDADGMTPLMYACMKCVFGPVKLLLDHGANVKLGGLSDCPPLNCVVTIVENHASNASEVAVANALLDHGADINALQTYGDTPLIDAIYEKDEKMVKFFCDRGADVNLPGNNHPDPPLIVAVEDDDVAIAKMLLSHGANVSYKTAGGDTALSLAKSKGDQDMITLVEKSGG